MTGSRPRLLDLPGGEQTQVDDVDRSLIGGYTWYVNRQGYVMATYWEAGEHKAVLLHRLLMGHPIGAHVDHINGDKLDNRRSNLRVATFQQNQANRKKPNKNNTSGLRGVAYRPKLSSVRPWHAQITANRKNIYLGLFTTKEEAIAARKAAEIEHFGEECP